MIRTTFEPQSNRVRFRPLKHSRSKVGSVSRPMISNNSQADGSTDAYTPTLRFPPARLSR